MSEIIVKINDRFKNRTIKYFNRFTFDFSYDTVGSTFSFDFYFDPDNIEHKELSCVTHYHEVQVFFKKQLILTGVLTNQRFTDSPVPELAGFSGYSKPGLLQDVSIPPSIYPLQSDGLSLDTIARKCISPWVNSSYKLKMVVDSAVSGKMSKAITKSTAGETSKIKEYLSGLAKQRDIVMSHNEKGELLFTQAKTDQKPVIEFDGREGMLPGTKMILDYDGTGMHSHIHVKKSASKDGGNAGESFIRNPLVVSSVYRPIVMTQSSGDDNDTVSAARRALGKELENGLKLTIDTDRWETVNGDMLLPNSIISVYNPKVYLYYKQNWFVKGIKYTGDETKTVATLDCVLPEAFNDKPVINPFRDINLHALGE